MTRPTSSVVCSCDHDCQFARPLPGGDRWDAWLRCQRPGAERTVIHTGRDCPAFATRRADAKDLPASLRRSAA